MDLLTEGAVDRTNIVKDRALRRGDDGLNVLTVQKLLLELGYKLSPDGDFGPNTEKAVIAFQKRVNLVPDGKVGFKTMSVLDNVDKTHKFLSYDDVKAGAAKLGVPMAVVMAVIDVESKGCGFFPEGKAVILYERHQMYRILPDYGIDPKSYVLTHPGIVNNKAGGYIGGIKEYDRLAKAMAISTPAAFESASWGAFQIMGYYWDLLGYKSVQEFVQSAQRSETNQFNDFINFVISQKGMHAALKAKDWAKFARLYNGINYAKYSYDKRLAASFIQYS